jgi:hypothetical protein
VKRLKQIFNFYINSSIHVALAVYSLAWITLVQFNLSYDEHVLYFVFYATTVAYNFVKYFGFVKFHHRQFALFLKWIQFVSVIALMAMCYYATLLNKSSLILVSFIGLATFFYAIPFIPRRFLLDEQRNLRQISGLKIYVIAIVWSLTTVLVPLVNNGVEISAEVLLALLRRGIYVVVLMLPFEIRDLKYDSLKLATIPQKIGIFNTKLFGAVLLVFFVVLDLFNTIAMADILLNAVLALVTFLFLVFAKKNQSKYYSAFWVESLPVLWLVLLLLFG